MRASYLPLSKEIISKAEAKSKALDFYFTGKPCSYGHISHRRVGNSECYDCERARNSGNSKGEPNWKKIKVIFKENVDFVPRAKAIKNNLTFYFTGRTCPKGHQARRYTSNGKCLKCSDEDAQKFRQTDKYRDYIKSEKYKNQRSKAQKKYSGTEKGKTNRSKSRKNYRKSEKYKNYRRSYEMEKIQNDPSFRLGKRLRDRIRQAIRVNKGKKSMTTEKLTGCTFEFLKNYLEKKFKKNMTWENYGEWHIDHIVPCSSFDLTKTDEQKRCFHYTNLQPLWATENFKKYNKTVKFK